MQKTRKLLVGIFIATGIIMGTLGSVFCILPRLTISLHGDAVVFPVIGAVFTAVGATFLVIAVIVNLAMRRTLRQREALLGYGRRASATVTSVSENFTITVNGRHPWIVTAVCTHPLTGRDVTVCSHSLWTCTVQPGQKVEIAFDPMNERKFAFDLHEPEESIWA